MIVIWKCSDSDNFDVTYRHVERKKEALALMDKLFDGTSALLLPVNSFLQLSEDHAMLRHNENEQFIHRIVELI